MTLYEYSLKIYTHSRLIISPPPPQLWVQIQQSLNHIIIHTPPHHPPTLLNQLPPSASHLHCTSLGCQLPAFSGRELGCRNLELVSGLGGIKWRANRLIFIINWLLFIQMNPLQQQNQPLSSQPTLRERQLKRYKYCCRKCKHTERGKKSCVCVVPLSQRRTSLTQVGCQTCKCKGCSIEDYIERGEDPEYRPVRTDRRQSVESEVNLCCKKCSSSKMHKRCVCQLPKNRRRNKLSSKGCKLCGCSGCNPKQESSGSSSSPSRNKSEQSSSENRVYNQLEYNFNNIDRSLIGRIVVMEYSLNPSMIGLGIPQRTPAYILGKPL